MLGIVAGIAAGLGLVFGLLQARRTRRRALAGARGQAQAILTEARAEAEAEHRRADIAAREEALAARAEAGAEMGELQEQLERREEHVSRHEQALAVQQERLTEIEGAFQARQQAVDAQRAKAQAADSAVREAAEGLVLGLERIAGETRSQIKAELVQGWIEETRADAAARLRAVDQSAQDPEHARRAKRLIGIAIGRYQGHYLSERLLSTIALPPGAGPRLLEEGAAIVKEIEEQSGTRLVLAEGDAVRIEGADGVGREVARRVLHRLLKGATERKGERGRPPIESMTLDLTVRDPKRLVQTVASNLDREIVDLGKKAFGELQLAKAHPDIIRLIGRLYYRTSYTQNQWKHSVEAGFLAGMMACELGLNPRLARRATLLHDLGKALSHEIEGSHATIGADYARRLGEDEIVVNAIAAHHGEVPCGSPYAHLVAAADALSGARPGARREMVETYVKRLADLERIAQSFSGVDRVYAVQAGREVRVQVLEEQVSDAGATEMATAIAQRISKELVFPGQIKVTVIRELRAVELAG
jgi:ribonucrease Y